MYKFTYNGNPAAIVTDDGYVYEYPTLKEAKEAAQNTEKINVVFNSGKSSQRNVEKEITPAVKQLLEVKLPTSSNDLVNI